MLQFNDLPVELVLKIFTYLPQFWLATIAQVCERWKELAFDPCLWTEVRINLRDMESEQQVREVLNRATLIRKLDVSGIIYIEDIASCSTHFKRLKELVVPCRALSHRTMPVILRNCESLTTVALRGKDTLLPNDHLKCLSVTRMSTGGLLHVSKARPNLESLKIGSVWNENDVTVAQALQTFLKLRILSVDGECGTGWFDTRFGTPRELERFDVQQLHMEEHQMNQLVLKCGEKLRHVTISARTLTQNALNLLHDCKNLESIAVYGVCGGDMLLKMLIALPKLVRAQLDVVGEAGEAVSQLNAVVDVLDKSARGHTRLVIRAHCASQAAEDDMVRAVWNLREYLAFNTGVSVDHIRDLEEQCWRMKDGKCFWVSWRRKILRTVQTSLPVMSNTLKYLVVNVYEN
ncbi:hypothetical protein HPB49_012859 [Dermacentor silvarum]|uniref:Uncharacterized protein n=1 Tax=Dermacentor silvarum TaxID=543639 RepID=A0ACB8CFE0_DERSI|nr:hypothetical protein HPB49_012859 [Dermacentor silvarum]